MEDFLKEDRGERSADACLVPTGTNVDAPTFAPYADALYLNNQKIINDTMFFVFAPTAYFTYYWTVVKRNLEWYHGYVPGIHNFGVLSSQTGTALCRMAAELTAASGISFEGDEAAETFLSKFYKDNNIAAVLAQHLPIQNAIGFMLTKVDIAADGQLSIGFVDGNRYFAQCDSRRNVTAFKACINFISADVSDIGDCSRGDRNGYFLVEERFYRKGKPCVRYRVYHGAVLATAPTYPSGGEVGLDEKDLPRHVRQMLKRNYVGKLNTIYELPFDDLGARVTPISLSATGVEDYHCFADGMLANCHTQLFELDLTKTQKSEHKYLAQDFLVMPERMIMQPTGDRYRDMIQRGDGYGSINKRIAKGATYSDPQKEAPFLYSPTRQIDAYNQDINQILNEIAGQCRFSPATVAGFLRPGVEITATQVTDDRDITRQTIKQRRELIANDLNYCNRIILKHYLGRDDVDCSVVFREGSLSNPSLDTDIIIKKMNAHLITHQMAVEEANPQLSKREAEKVYETAAAEAKAQQQQPFDGLDELLGASE